MLGSAKRVGMKWLSLHAVVVLVTFIGVNTQCLARCAGIPCHGSHTSSEQNRESQAPPCHRHPGPAKAPSHVCQISLFVVEKQVPGVAKLKVAGLEPIFLEPPFSVHIPLPVYTRRTLGRETSPPFGLELTFSTVLRI